MLEEITKNRVSQVEKLKALYPEKLLETSMYFDSKCVSLKHYLKREDKSGIIAEFKRKSPSKGILNQYADVVETTMGYMQAGASGLSVITETDYFMGKSEDLTKARNANFCPILRKDFIVDEYQVIETKSIGADVILLIAASHSKEKLKSLYDLSLSLGLEVLFEVHELSELDKIPGDEVIIGVNNRNLKTMQVDLNTSITLSKELSQAFVLVSESGIKTVADIKTLKQAGYQGFLMGEHFMTTPYPAETLSDFIKNL